MGFWKGKDGEDLGQVLFGLGLGSSPVPAFRVGFDEVLEAFFGVGAVVSIESIRPAICIYP